MKKLLLFTFILVVCVGFINKKTYAQSDVAIQFDDVSKTRIKEVFQILKDNNLKSDEEKIDLISAYFLETPYVANRMVGSNDVKEELVIALNELDCFTYLDYLETFKRSRNEAEFIENLKLVRYIDGEVTYLKRKHFYSDWISENTVLATDVLSDGAYTNSITTDKVFLNQGKDNNVYVNGLAIRERDINYVPRENITADFLKTLKTGDFIGFRRDIPGLDVTHTGLIIQKEDGTYLRHASSAKSNRKVVDQKLTDYLDYYKKVIGILVFRSNASFQEFTSDVTIRYIDEKGLEISNSILKNVPYGSEIEVDVLEIPHYNYKNIDGEMIANLDEKTINVVYSEKLITLDNNGVNVKGFFKDTYNLEAVKIDKVVSSLKDNEYDVYSIDIKDTQNQIIKINQPLEITIPKKENRKIKSVYYVVDDNNLENLEIINQNDKTVTFKVNHLSDFSLVYEKVVSNNVVTTKPLPQTGTIVNYTLPTVMILISLFSLTKVFKK